MANLLISVSDATQTSEAVINIYGKDDEVVYLSLPTTQVATAMVIPNMITLTIIVE